MNASLSAIGRSLRKGRVTVKCRGHGRPGTPLRPASEIERTVAWDLKKLRSGKIAHTQQAKAHLAGYFALQYTRTPWFRELANKSAITLQHAGLRYFFEKPGELEKFIGELKEQIGGEIKVESLKAYMARVLNGEIPMVQRNKAWNAKIMLEHADALGRVFFAMRWNLLEAAPGSTFITSDHPLHIVDPVAARMSSEGFKFSKEMEFYIPLSPQLMLVGDRQGGLTGGSS